MIRLVDLFFQIYSAILLVKILGSWVPEFQQYRIMQFVNFYANPYLNLFRRLIPPLGMMDLSPIVAFICLDIVRALFHNILQSLFRL